MSGWIKLEKDLETDPRVLRIAKQVDRLFFLFDVSAELDPCNARALPGVTLVCGALARLWVFADSHIREDDTLDMGAADLDEWLGIPGFCGLMPDDWLRVLDDSTVELPGFQEHNGVEAKKRALTQKRVTQHRSKQQRTSVTPRNASALPDQTRPDQEETRPEEEKNASATRDAEDDAPEFEALRALYPKRSGDQRWHEARQAIRARLREGHTWEQILDGTRRYAEWCKATGKIGTETVKQAATFVGPGKPFLEPWAAPLTKADTRLSGNLAAAAQAKRELFGSAS